MCRQHAPTTSGAFRPRNVRDLPTPMPTVLTLPKVLPPCYAVDKCKKTVTVDVIKKAKLKRLN